jgi:hypothetical protein
MALTYDKDCGTGCTASEGIQVGFLPGYAFYGSLPIQGEFAITYQMAGVWYYKRSYNRVHRCYTAFQLTAQRGPASVIDNDLVWVLCERPRVKSDDKGRPIVCLSKWPSAADVCNKPSREPWNESIPGAVISCHEGRIL